MKACTPQYPPTCPLKSSSAHNVRWKVALGGREDFDVAVPAALRMWTTFELVSVMCDHWSLRVTPLGDVVCVSVCLCLSVCVSERRVSK
jgi:hypothetical protein